MERIRKRAFIFILLMAAVFVGDIILEDDRARRLRKIQKPLLISPTVEPFKIKVGETQITRVAVASSHDIEQVTARIPFEGGYDEIALALVSGDQKNGNWEGRWIAHNTLTKEYQTEITATDDRGNTQKATAIWWDDTETVWLQDWNDRERVVLTETSGTELVDHKTEVTIPYQDEMQPDFDDVRFTSADGNTLLPYYLESKADSSTATFWITVPTLPASAATSIYYYFGNAAAASLSDNANAPEGGATTSYWTETATADFADGTLSGTTVGTDEVALTWGAASQNPGWSLRDWSGSVVAQDDGTVAIPCLADLTNDGVLDLISGNYPGTARGFVNLGTASSPNFNTTYDDWGLVIVDYSASPAVADLDNDGDYDFMIGSADGGVYAALNIGTAAEAMPQWEPSWDLTGFASATHPVLADLDNDADFDMLVGTADGEIHAYRNSGSVSSPAWTAQLSWDPPSMAFGTRLSLGDLDGDGDFDLLAGDGTSTIYAFKNTGSVSSPAWEAEASWDISDAGSPALGDLDNDGDLDLITGYGDGSFSGYENTPTAGGTGYPASGSVVSSTFDGAYQVQFASLDFTATTPTSTSVKFQLAGNNDNATWNFLGPDGTAASYYTAASTTFSAKLQGKRYLKYKAYLETTDAEATPILESVTVGYELFSGIWTETTTADFGDGVLSGVEVGSDEVTLGMGSGDPVWTGNDWSGSLVAFDSGTAAVPSLVDLDNDGDLDLAVGIYYGAVKSYTNTGTQYAPTWVLDDSWSIIIENFNAVPAFADLDNDGDYDMMIGASEGKVHCWQNIGTASSPNFAEQLSWDSPDLGGGDEYAHPSFADLDNDGDYDMLIGAADGTTDAYKNTGSSSSPVWTAESGWNVPSVGVGAEPTLADLDNDGDFDLMVGGQSNTVFGYENTGSITSPAWSAQSDWNISSGYTPALGDVDGDGDQDLMMGEGTGGFYGYENTPAGGSGYATAGNLVSSVLDSEAVLKITSLSFSATQPASTSVKFQLAANNDNATWNFLGPDGTASSYYTAGSTSFDPDVQGKRFLRYKVYLETTDTAVTPAVQSVTIDYRTFSGVWLQTTTADFSGGAPTQVVAGSDKLRLDGTVSTDPVWTATSGWNTGDLGTYAVPDLVDLDGDGDLDVLIGLTGGESVAYENTGSISSPAWAANTGWNAPDPGARAIPAFGDLDGDGDQDLLIGETTGNTNAYQNTGSVSSPAWTAQAGWVVGDIGASSAPALADLDNDGDLDLMIGLSTGAIKGYRNTGSSASPTWAANTAWNVTRGTYAIPELADIDGDGDFDLLIGDADGIAYAYKNTGTAASPTFTATTSWNAPDVGTYSAPAMGDLDNDGIVDLLIGSNGGVSYGYDNIPASTYLTSGDLVSSAFDGTAAIDFGAISFGKTVPANTLVKFQLATNDDNSTWDFVGPDGTSDTYYSTSGEATAAALDGKRYVKYKTFLETTNTGVTPELLDVSVYFSPTPSAGGGGPVPTVTFSTQFETRPRPAGATGVSGDSFLQF